MSSTYTTYSASGRRYPRLSAASYGPPTHYYQRHDDNALTLVWWAFVAMTLLIYVAQIVH